MQQNTKRQKQMGQNEKEKTKLIQNTNRHDTKRTK